MRYSKKKLKLKKHRATQQLTKIYHIEKSSQMEIDITVINKSNKALQFWPNLFVKTLRKRIWGFFISKIFIFLLG